MGDNHSFLALDWVKGEIEETLKQAQQALEGHVENPDDPTRMRFCLAYLHQVYGTLQMVEFYGAALLAEEMEKLALALINNKVARVGEGQEVLMRGILQLPPYLERVKASRRDLPVVLLPLLNDLRAVQGEALLSETALFTPDLAAGERAPIQVSGQGADPRLLKKMRRLFQVALLGLIRQDKIDENLTHLEHVFTRLEKISGPSAMRELWQVSGALVEGLQEKSVDAGTSIKMLLGQVDRQLRQLGTDPEQRPPTELMKNLLYYVAKSNGQTPRLRAVKDLYRLDDALPGDTMVSEERARMVGPDREAIRSVVEALCDELARVKDVLDLFVRNQSPRVSELAPMVPILKQVADTVAVLGLGQPRRILQEQIEAIDRMTASGVVPRDGSLLDVAGALLYVEATLNGMVADKPLGAGHEPGEVTDLSGQKQLSEAQAAVLRESRGALEQSKDAVIEFIASQWNPKHLEAIPELINTVRGGLTILNMPRPAELLGRASQYINERLLKEQYRPDWPEMDTLADIITSVEYYLERAANDSQGGEAVLDIAEAGLAKLGYEMPPRPATAPVRAAPVVAASFTEVPAVLAAEPAPVVVESLAAVEPEPVVEAAAPEVDFNATLVNAPDEAEAAEAALDESPAAADQDFNATLVSPPAAAPAAAEFSLADFGLGDFGFSAVPASPAPVAPAAPVAAEATMLNTDGMAEATMISVAPAVHVSMEGVPSLAALRARMKELEADTSSSNLFGGELTLSDFSLDDVQAPIEIAEPVVFTTTMQFNRAQLVAEAPAVEAVTEPAAEATESVVAESAEEEPAVDFNTTLVHEPAAIETESAEMDAESEVDFNATLVHEPAAGETESGEVDAVLAEAAESFVAEVVDAEPEVDFNATLVQEPAAIEAESGDMAELASAEGAAQPDMAAATVEPEVLAEPDAEAPALADESLESVAEVAALAEEPETALAADAEEAPAAEPAAVAELVDAEAEVEGVALEAEAAASAPEVVAAVVPVPAPVAAPVLAALPPDDFSFDDEIREIFIEEAEEVLEAINEYFPTWAANFEERDALGEFRRGFHTLKGSGRMVGARTVSELAWSIESMLNKVRDNTVHPNQHMVQLIAEALEVLPGLIEDFSGSRAPRFHTGALMATAEALGRGETPTAAESAAVADAVAEAVEAAADARAEIAAAAPPVPRQPARPLAMVAMLPDDFSFDDEIREIFVEEAEEVLEAINEYFPTWAGDFNERDALVEFRRGFHTLKGSGRMVGAKSVGELAWSIESMLNKVRDNIVEPSQSMVNLISETLAILPGLVEDFAGSQPPRFNTSALMGTADELGRGVPVTTVEVAHAAEFAHGAYVDAAAESGEYEDEEPTAADFDALAASLAPAAPVVAETIAAVAEDEVLAELPEEAFADAPGIESMDMQDAIDAMDAGLSTLEESSTPATADVDPVLLEIFTSEADAHLDEIQAFLSAAHGARNAVVTDQVLRNLHTLKGSAGMAGIAPVADVAAPMEHLFKDLRNQGVAASREHLDALQQSHDVIRSCIQNLLDGGDGNVGDSGELIAHVRQLDYDRLNQLDKSDEERREAGITDTQWDETVTAATEGRVASFMALGLDHLLDAPWELDAWLLGTERDEKLQALRDELSRLAPAARRARIEPLALVSERLIAIYDRVAGNTLGVDTNLLNDLSSAHDEIINIFDTLAASQTVEANQRVLEQLLDWLDAPVSTTVPAISDEPAVASFEVMEPEQPSLADTVAEGVAESGSGGLAEAEAEPLDPELLDIFLEEAEEVLEEVDNDFSTWLRDPANKAALGALQRHLHTVKGGARLAQIKSMGDLAHELESLYEGLREGRFPVNKELTDLLQRCHDRLSDMVSQLRRKAVSPPATELLAAIDNYRRHPDGVGAVAEEDLGEHGEGEVLPLTTESGYKHFDQPLLFSEGIDQHQIPDEEEAAVPPEAGPADEWVSPPPAPVVAAAPPVPVAAPMVIVPLNDVDPELLEIFLEEAGEIVDATSEQLSRWMQDTNNTKPVQELQRGLHTLKGGARMAEIKILGDLAHTMEDLYEGLCSGVFAVTPALLQLLQRCHDRLAVAVEILQSGQGCPTMDDLIERLHSYIADPHNFQDIPTTVSLTPAAPAPVVAPAPQPAPVAAAAPVAKQEDNTDEVDADILEIFFEESDELSEAIEAAIGEWTEDRDNRAPMEALLRHLHTLKGGARLAGLKDLGNMAHEFESDLVLIQQRLKKPDEAFFNSLSTRFEQILVALKGIRQRADAGSMAMPVPQPSTPAPAVRAPEPAPAPAPVAAPVRPAAPVAAGPVAGDSAHRQLSHSALAPDAERAPPPPMSGSFRNLQGNRGPQEMIRVPSELLEKLVNLAGETSITRSRVEMGVHGFAQTVEEMGVTIQRLADQLRRMDSEMETQIISRHGDELNEQGQSKYEDFDPLEMDQYSSLNQLSKALAESASDLLDLKSTLIDKARDTETLLLQQSRINTELQEGLMRSRMVPFSRLVPRLKRIVRQTAQELGKIADLEVINPEGEMDRTLLERVVVPLEHMLRNAVDHGIESQAARSASGKAAQGQVTLTLSREGGEVVLTLVDDGAGINIEAVRRKAMERGLIKSRADATDEEVIQFIFHAGFSTAEKVTQISGRGVGMDVVQSEIKQMGGVVSIASNQGKGTIFTIRLPFTVAVNRALMVRVGGDVYAVPLAQIEGIVRASPYELDTYYSPGAPLFEYAGVAYRLSYLGEFVHGIKSPNLVGHVLPLPVLLVRGAGEQRIAIQVDQLIGSREIVVKSVGIQLSSVAGISGATILGDGSVVIILDVVAMLRAAAISQPRLSVAPMAPVPTVAAVEVPTARTVMVVDDSVTVRKVTSRLLERHGYAVILAKDGLDAIAKLEETKPDVMLLDIEMPRMDGFEVASLVRHNPKLEDLPIIMITSRTGEKHRERAFQIGVNCYMGKPFQEQQLLETIAELLDAVVGQ
jgi:chemosensory pili system protein ChpA (sensor histidine kinase/response regulator)